MCPLARLRCRFWAAARRRPSNRRASGRRGARCGVPCACASCDVWCACRVPEHGLLPSSVFRPARTACGSATVPASRVCAVCSSRACTTTRGVSCTRPCVLIVSLTALYGMVSLHLLGIKRAQRAAHGRRAQVSRPGCACGSRPSSLGSGRTRTTARSAHLSLAGQAKSGHPHPRTYTHAMHMRRRGAACDPLSLRQQSAHSMHSRPTANPKPLTINGFCVKAFLTSSLIRASFSAPSVDLRMSPHSSAYLIRGEKG